jgi:GxxExxY protein
MHAKYAQSDRRTHDVIGAAIEVHRLKGPGLLESIYQKCMERELLLRDVPTKRQVIVPVHYKGLVFDEPLRLDLLVDDCLIVELKSVEDVVPVHKAQLLSYMKLMDLPLGSSSIFIKPSL